MEARGGGGSVFNACTISAKFPEIYFAPSIRIE